MPASTVSIHPYFKVRAGQLEAARALLPRFVAATSGEAGVLHYEFTAKGDEIFCREAYVNADAVLKHLANVDALLQEMLTLADLSRLEFHGPAEELAQLHAPLAALHAAYFEVVARLER